MRNGIEGRDASSAVMQGKTNGASSAGFALWRAAMRWQRAIDKALLAEGLTHAQYLVLSSANCLCDEADDAVMQRQIAERAGLDQTTTSRVARALESRGLLDRGPTFGDCRAWRVFVTSRGRAVLKRAAPLVDEVSERLAPEVDATRSRI